MSKSFSKKYLNKQQSQVVKANKGPHLVIAGAGTGKCITGESLVLTEKGIIKIEDIVTVDFDNYICDLFTFDDNSYNIIKCKSSHYYKFKKTDVIELTTENGFSITGTFMHPIKCIVNNSPVFKELQDITINDTILMTINTEKWSKLKSKVTKADAIKLGVNLASQHKFSNISIPTEILKSPRHILLKFLQTFLQIIASETYNTITYTICSKTLVNQLHTILSNLGIFVKTKKFKAFNSDYYTSIFSKSDFCLINYKKPKKAFLKDKTYTVKVASLKRLGEKLVYDFTVPEHHSFIANSFINHNTASLTHRIAHLVSKRKVISKSILLLTFTRKAADEMLSRVSKLIGEGREVEGGTFHSFAYKALFRYANKLGYKKYFSIIDKTDSETLIDVISDKLNFKGKEFFSKAILMNIFSKSINHNKTIDIVIQENYADNIDNIHKVKKVFSLYKNYKKRHNLMDYDDLLVNLLKLLKKKDIRKTLCRKYKFILIDEFQDTNYIQLEISKRLCYKHKNIMVCGDDSQCWSGKGIVNTNKGKSLVEDLKKGDKVDCSYLGKIVKKRITNITKENNTTLTFLTESGLSLTVTNNHKMFALQYTHKNFNPRNMINIILNDSNYKKHICVKYLNTTKLFDNYKEAINYVSYYKESLKITDIIEKFKLPLYNSCYLNTFYAKDIKLGVHIPIICKGNFKLDKIIKIISNKEEEPVYDIEIAEAGNLIVNSILSHNSIYRFRGAVFKNIIDFPSLFNKCKVLTIEQNYRSTQPILNLANKVIGLAEERYEKNLFTKRDSTKLPYFYRPGSDIDQTNYVVKRILELQKTLKLHNIAILFRSGYQSADIELALTTMNIPYVKYGGLKFLETAHAKDFMAILKLLYNKKDMLSWIRLLTRFRGIGSRIAGKIAEEIKEKNNLKPLLIKDTKYSENLNKVYKFLKKTRKLKNSVDKSIKSSIDFYTPILETTFNKPALRLKGLNSFSSLGTNFESVRELVSYLMIDDIKDDLSNKNKVILSTIHSIKGLEHKVVFILNVNNGSIPNYHAKSQESIEEERRLLYVAITRAKDEVHLIAPLNDLEVEQLTEIGKIRDSDNSTSNFLQQIDNLESYIQIPVISNLGMSNTKSEGFITKKRVF